ncbi:unnamed protein product, partial [Brassica oleracea]
MAANPFRPPPHLPDFGFPSSDPNLSLTKFPPALSIPRASFVPNKFSSLGSPWTLPSLPTDSIVSSALVDLLPQVSSTTTA